MIHDHPSFDDGRGRYPDRIAAAAPRGFRAEVKRAAQAERITMSEFVRRAICARLTTMAGLPDDNGPSNFPPAAGQRKAA
jgi:hypothetical protein